MTRSGFGKRARPCTRPLGEGQGQLSANSTVEENERLLPAPTISLQPASRMLGCWFEALRPEGTRRDELPPDLGTVPEAKARAQAED